MSLPARSMLYRAEQTNVVDKFGGGPISRYVPAWPLDAEGPGENLRNGLALLGAYRTLNQYGHSPEADAALDAVQRRIETALDQLEGKP